MIHEFMIGTGQDIKDGVQAFMLEQGWENAYISGAVGSIQDMAFTTPIGPELPPQVITTSCDGPAEVLAFTGEIMKKEHMDPALKGVYRSEGPLFIHIHASVATTGGRVSGGGLHQGRAFRALKIYIQPMSC